MISCLSLERPGWCRVVVVGFVLAVIAFPSVPLLIQGVFTAQRNSLGDAFYRSLINSVGLSAVVVVVALVTGLSTGVIAALYNFRGRHVMLALAVLPVLLPSFLVAIGWSSLFAQVGLTASASWSRWLGCFLTFVGSAAGMTMLVSYLAARGLSASQLDATHLAGGHWLTFKMACRHALPASVLAAALGGILSLTDPGPGMIFGFKSVAAETLISFSAFHDLAMAGQQCVILSITALLLTLPLAILFVPRLADALLAKHTRRFCRMTIATAGVTGALMFAVVLCIGSLLPLAGLCWPLLRETSFQQAAAELRRAGIDTLLYAMGAGGLAAVLAMVLAIMLGRYGGQRVAAVALLLMVLVLPSTMSGLGVVQLGTRAPGWLDPLLRSRVTVCIVLGLHYAPVAVLLILRAWSATSITWTEAAAIHGVSLTRYLLHVVLPQLAPAVVGSVIAVGLLATADVGTVLLTHPPGHGSFPLAIFTIMSNAPESLVASLCMVYFAGSALVLAVLWRVSAGWAT